VGTRSHKQYSVKIRVKDNEKESLKLLEKLSQIGLFTGTKRKIMNGNQMPIPVVKDKGLEEILK